MLAASVAPLAVPARVLGREGAVVPNSRINVALIGTGRQVFHANMPWFLWSKDVQVVAVCDADAWRMDMARQAVEANYAAAAGRDGYAGCATHRDFREVLARKDVDAVMISAPDHWHAHMAVAAAQAGKDIALEKPISLCVREGRAIADAVKRHGRVLRTDTEVRAHRPYHHLCQVVRNGLVGEVRRVVVTVPSDPPPLAERWPATEPVPAELDYNLWLGPAPVRHYAEKRVHYRQAGLDYVGGKGPGWMHIQDYSLGVMLNWGTHVLDITQWLLDEERGGPVEVKASARFPTDNLWDVAQRFKVRYRYASGVEVHYANGEAASVRVEGAEGWISHTWFKEQACQASAPGLLTWVPQAGDVHLPRADEKQDFIDCVRSRAEPLITAENGHRTATLCQLGHIAARLGRTLKWDAAAERVIRDEEANALLARPYREPWALPAG
jgi:predicted dehydrogenase